MKKILFLALMIPFAMTAQTQEQNYIKTIVYKDSLTTTSNPPDSSFVASVTYFDGLGRPIQQITGSQTNGGNDIVTHIAYDAYGRQPKEYLPYDAKAADLEFKDSVNAVSNLYDFYANYREGTSNPYSEKFFEASPLNRVMKQAAPGNDWVGNANDDHDKTIKFDYQTNDTLEVRHFRVVLALSGIIYNPTFDEDGYYLPGTLYKTITKDENWISGYNHTTEEFKDKNGKVILKRNYESNVALDTYYVYDLYGNLTYVIPPLVENDWGDKLDGLCYQYKYDTRNRMAAKKLPGKQWEYIVYDKLDRPILTGPAYGPFGKNETGWLLTKYDVYGRVCYTGWHEAAVNQAEWASYQGNRNTTSDILYESRSSSPVSIDGINVSYTNDYFITQFVLLTVNYYDDYNYYGAPPSGLLSFEVSGQPLLSHTCGLSTGTLVRVLSNSDYLVDTSCVLYDKKARPILNYKKNYMGGYTLLVTKLDFSGKTRATYTEHQPDAYRAGVVFREDFTYTPQDRLLSHIHTMAGEGPQLLAYNEYDALGTLITKDVGGEDVSGFIGLQKVNFKHNIRGWLTDINKIDSLEVPGQPKDLFAFKINYNKVDNDVYGQVEGLFNGNIAETYWESGSDNIVRKYGYVYDALDRLRGAIYQKPNQTVSVPHSYDEWISYDKNGNIIGMNRKGLCDFDDVSITIDEMGYSYANDSNRLMKVTDSSNSHAGFNDDSNGTNDTVDDYEYDDYGNVLSDQNKHITRIKYNHLNLPVEFTFSNSDKIIYLYDAAGSKLKKYVVPHTGSPVPAETTEYLDGFQYVQDTLRFFPHAEGYVNVLHDGESTYHNYVFNYTDHLGNIRVSWAYDKEIDGLKILEENHYYAFGLKHENYNAGKKDFEKGEEEVVITPQDKKLYKYKYNGKEWQDELGLNMYDYGARNYDPAIGRWMNIDPLAEESRRWSPYTYANDNPVYFIDPDGMSASPIYDPNGNFLGTDENGLKGMAVVMNKENFSQGMSAKDAENKNLGQEGFKNDDAASKAFNHYDGLKNRPDYDGKLTLSEANDWYRNGKGEPLFVDSGKIDLSPVSTADFKDGVGSEMYKNFFLTTNTETGLVYGTLKLTLDDAGGTVTIGGKGGRIDTYDFDQKGRDGTLKRDFRNLGTKAGEILAGKGNPFDIFGYGKGKIK